MTGRTSWLPALASRRLPQKPMKHEGVCLTFTKWEEVERARKDSGSEDRIALMRIIAALEGANPQVPVTASRVDHQRWWPWLVVLPWTVITYLAANFGFPGSVEAGFNIYILQPLMWSFLALLAFAGWNNVRHGRPSRGWDKVAAGGLAGLGHVAILMLVGLLFSFGRSPYSRGFPAWAGNLLFALTMMAGIEMTRAYLLARFRRQNLLMLLGITALFATILDLPAAKFGAITGMPSLISFLGGDALPQLSMHALAGMLALLGGPLPAMAYRGVLVGFEWLSPILPNLNWKVQAFVGTAVPILGMLWLQDVFVSNPAKSTTEESIKQQPGMIWLPVAALAVSLLWINLGLFGIQPTVVSGPSMSPAIETGDIVLTSQVPIEAIEVGDIVRYRDQSRFIIHRVVQVVEAEPPELVTRGDANNRNDEPFTESQLAGRVILIVPKLGWVNLSLRQFIAWIFP